MRPLLLIVAMSLLLAGCTDSGPDSDGGPSATPPGGNVATPTVAPDGPDYEVVTVTGVVFDPAFVPVAGARVSIHELKMEAVTDAEGMFAFDPVPAGLYSLIVAAEGFSEEARAITPEQTGELELSISLRPLGVQPYHETFPRFQGYVQCVLEALIITPSCDTILTTPTQAGGPDLSVLTTENTVEFWTEEDWATMVVDLAFDLEEHPGIAGMRVSLYGGDESVALGSYERMARASGDASFSTHWQAGEDYGDAVSVPAGPAGFQLQFFPQGHGGGTLPVLGVGAGVQFEFEALITIFYVDPAPADWTLLDG